MWKNVEKFKRYEYFCKPLYLVISWRLNLQILLIRKLYRAGCIINMLTRNKYIKKYFIFSTNTCHQQKRNQSSIKTRTNWIGMYSCGLTWSCKPLRKLATRNWVTLSCDSVGSGHGLWYHQYWISLMRAFSQLRTLQPITVNHDNVTSQTTTTAWTSSTIRVIIQHSFHCHV